MWSSISSCCLKGKAYTDKVWSNEGNSQNLQLVHSVESRVSVCIRLYAGVYSKHRGLAGWLLEEELRRKKDPHILRQQAASELELERRNILSAMRYSNPERGGPWLVTMSIMTPSQSTDQQKIYDHRRNQVWLRMCCIHHLINVHQCPLDSGNNCHVYMLYMWANCLITAASVCLNFFLWWWVFIIHFLRSWSNHVLFTAASSGLSESSLNNTSQNKKEPVSKAEAERQQIIQDMKKKNALLTDNSWIRQSTVNNVNKQPINLPMRRSVYVILS